MKRVINVIVVGPKGYLDAKAELEQAGIFTRLGFEKAWWQGMRFFHRDGRIYQVASASLTEPLGLLAKLLPSWILNPTVRISYTYQDVGGYVLAELVSGVEAAIAQDDDIITQFRDASSLLKRLSGAKTFDGVSAVLAYARVGP